VGGDAQRLAEVFLRQPGNPGLAVGSFGPRAVKPLNDHGEQVAKARHLGLGHRQTQRAQQLCEQPLDLHGVADVEPASADLAQQQLEVWMVGVAPSGRPHWSSTLVRAVFSLAPAMEMRRALSSSVSVRPSPDSLTACCRWRSMSASFIGSNGERVGSWQRTRTGPTVS
jgi:hypothetical protein